MVTFIMWVAIIGSLICVLVYASIVVVITLSLCDWVKRRRVQEVLPPPDRAAERMYDIQYFIRAIGRK